MSEWSQSLCIAWHRLKEIKTTNKVSDRFQTKEECVEWILILVCIEQNKSPNWIRARALGQVSNAINPHLEVSKMYPSRRLLIIR